MKIAFSFDNTLADCGAGRDKRFFAIRALWNSLHDAGHALAIVSRADAAAGHGDTDGAREQKRRDEIAHCVKHYGLAPPRAVYVTVRDKLEFVRTEKVDLYIDGVMSYCKLAERDGITTLHLL